MYAEGTEWEQAREVAGRLFKTDPERVVIEVDRGTVLINFQESMAAEGYIRIAVTAAVKAVLPPDHADLKVTCV